MFAILLTTTALGKFCPVLEDNFDQGVIDLSVWTHDQTLAGGGNWEFQWYTNNRTNSYVEDGVMYIRPTLTIDYIGDKMLNGGYVNLWSEGCTNNGWYGCEKSSGGGNIINPIRSAALRTIQSHSIQYGKVEVRAKLPKGDWIWPAIWLLPKRNVYGGWPASGEIDIMESRGNKPGSGSPGYDEFGSTLHWGTDFFTNQWATAHRTYKLPDGKTFADDFHTFGMIWDENRIKTYVDDESNVVLDIEIKGIGERSELPAGYSSPWPKSRPSAPFDQEFYLIINVAVGGTAEYFKDGLGGKPWTNKSPRAALDFWNARDQWLKTWPEDDSRALAVDWVKIWSQC